MPPRSHCLIGNVEGYHVEHEYAVLQEEVADSKILMEKSSNLGWLACFKGANLRRTLLSTIPFSMQVSVCFCATGKKHTL